MKNKLHNNINRRAGFFLSTLLASLLLSANTHAVVTLDDISYSALSGDRVQITMQFSEPLADEPVNFTIDNPARIAIDLPDVALNLEDKNQTIGVGAAHSVIAVAAAGRTRVVVNLVNSVSYDLELQDNILALVLEGSVLASADVAAPGSFAAARTSSLAAAGIEDIDFRRGDAGEGRIIVTLSDPSVAVNLGQESGQIVVDFMSANLPAALDRRLDVIDFATPVREIDTSAYGDGVRMLISTVTQQYDHLAYQADDQPLSAAEQEAVKKDKFGYTGERLSFNFQDIEVRAVLQLLADFTGFNLVVSDTVGGSLTLRLKNVPWDQALEIILKARGRKTGAGNHQAGRRAGATAYRVYTG